MTWLRSNSTSAARYADIHIQVREIQQLFNSFDPSPFPDRDLDERAEEFITGWAMEHPSHLPIRLRITLSQPLSPQVDPQAIGESVRHYFDYRCEALGRQLRQLLAVGRTSLAVGLVCLGVSVGMAHVVDQLSENPWMSILRESLIIGGWVAMWRPLQIFLYDWWPLQRRRVLYRRLANAEVRLTSPPHAPLGPQPGIPPHTQIRPATPPNGMPSEPVSGLMRPGVSP